MVIEDEMDEGDYVPEEMRATCINPSVYAMVTRNAKINCLIPNSSTIILTAQETVICW